MTTPPRKAPKIDPEFRDLLNPLTPEEKEGLEALILAEGCREKLIVWDEQDILIDGHNRLDICTRHQKPYQVKYMNFPDRAAVAAWIIQTQLGRRNLTEERRAYYRGKQYLAARETQGGDRTKAPAEQNAKMAFMPPATTAEKIAEKHGVSPRTINRDAAFAQSVDTIGAADPKKKDEILAGKAGTKEEVIRQTRPIPSKPARGKKKAAAAKPGQVIAFDWPALEQKYAALVRAYTHLPTAYPDEQTRRDCAAGGKLLNEIEKNWKALRKRLNK